MKTKQVIFLIALGGSSLFIKAQTIKPLPQFKNDILIVKTFEELGTIMAGSIDISDGSELKYYTEYESLKSENQPENASTLAQVLNELKKQKYKLIGTNSGGGGGGGGAMSSGIKSGIVVISNYIFQKEN